MQPINMICKIFCIGILLLAGALGIYFGFFFKNNDSVADALAKQLQNTHGKLMNDMEYYRLPDYIRPVHQFVRLQPYFSENYQIVGYTEINLELLQPSSTIVLHMVDIITKNDTIKLVKSDDASQEIAFDLHTYDPERSFYIAYLTEELPVGTYYLSMEFEGYLNNNLLGFYRTSYTDGNTTVPLAVSQFAAIEARRAFPCFDEPSMKSTFEIEMIRESHLRTLSNMPRTSATELPDQPGWFIDVFDTSVPMSTYLVAFVISDFVFVDSNENDHVLFRVWTRPDAIDTANYAVDIGPKILMFYEEYYQIPFPLPKQDMVAVPDFYYGAMENWGLVTYRGSALLYSEEISSAAAKQSVCRVIAHELAHQWFGNLVTNSWWNDVWLNEGFATLIQNYGCHSVEPTFGMVDQFLPSFLHTAFEVDALETSHPLNFPIDQPSDILRIYDTITYNKGGSILNMIQHFITEDSFQKGLVTYLNEFSYSNAEREDLWEHLTFQSHDDGTLDESLTIKQVMDPWALQVGYPLLTVIREENGDILLRQTKFEVTNSSISDQNNSTWWIPLSYTHQEEADFSDTRVMEWMSADEVTKNIEGIPATSNWVVFNIQQTGYYRVNYDTDMWNALVNQMINNHDVIHLRNRAQILNDVYSLAKAGLTSYDIALGMNSYLNKEEEYVPLKVALKELQYLQNMFQQEDGYTVLKDYLLSLLVPLYNSVGFDDDLNDPHLTQLKRSLITTWTCDLEYEDCTTSAEILYSQWMAQPENYTIISPNLKEAVYCSAIADGGVTEWEFALNQYQITTIAAEQGVLLQSMGCSRDTTLLERYMDLAFTEGGGIRKQDVDKVVSSVAQNPLGEMVAWNYVVGNAEDIASYMGAFSYVGTYVDLASENFNTEEELQEINEFKSDFSEELGSSTQSVDRAIERTTNNIDWMNNYYALILEWLSNNGMPMTACQNLECKQV